MIPHRPRPEKGLTVVEYARATGLGRTTVYERLRAGVLRHEKSGGRTVILDVPERAGVETTEVPVGPFTSAEYADAFAVANTTVYRWAAAGRVEHQAINGTLIITAAPACPLPLDHPAAGGPAGQPGAEPGPSEPPPGLVPIAQAAPKFGVQKQTVREWIKRGRLDGELVNGRWHVPAEQVPKRTPRTPKPKGLTVSEFARASGATRTTVYEWIEAGTVQTVTARGRRLVTTDPGSIEHTPREYTPKVFTPERGMTSPDFARACGVPTASVNRWVRLGKVDTETIQGRVVVLSDPADFQPFTGGLTEAAFATATGLSRSTVNAWGRAGKLQTVIARGRKYVTDDPEDFKGRARGPYRKARPHTWGGP